MWGGIDIGTRNFSVTFIEDDYTSHIFLIDMHVHEGRLVKLKACQFSEVVTGFVREYDGYLRRCRALVIEDQMAHAVKTQAGGSRLAVGGGKQTMRLMCAHVESALRSRYPDMCVRVVRPASVRKHFGTSVRTTGNGRADYTKRKQRSLEPRLMGMEDRLRYASVFQKQESGRTVLKVDGVESAMLALYARHYETRLRVPVEYEAVSSHLPLRKVISLTVRLDGEDAVRATPAPVVNLRRKRAGVEAVAGGDKKRARGSGKKKSA